LVTWFEELSKEFKELSKDWFEELSKEFKELSKEDIGFPDHDSEGDWSSLEG